MATVPLMVYHPLTKTGNEVWIYYNLGNAVLKKRKSSLADVIMPNCGGVQSCPAGSWDASILSVTGPGAAFGGFLANAPIFSAVVGEVVPEAGASIDLVCLPNWDDNILLCYDESFSETPGMPYRAIPRKFWNADHYVRQRADNTLRIDDKYVSNWDGLRAIAGRRVTIVVVVMPQGGAEISEVIYYCNFMCIPPAMNYGADQNASIVLSGEGAYSIKAIFSAFA